MTTSYTVTVELDTREAIDEALLDALAPYHPATGRGIRGHVQVIITLPAEDIVQVAQTAIAVLARAHRAPVLTLEAMPTAEFDRRLGLDPLPELVSVTQAADLLDVSRQAVLQRLESGSLVGEKVGNAWVVQRAQVEAQRAALRRALAKGEAAAEEAPGC